jgi:hypothetical protein
VARAKHKGKRGAVAAAIKKAAAAKKAPAAADD